MDRNDINQAHKDLAKAMQSARQMSHLEKISNEAVRLQSTHANVVAELLHRRIVEYQKKLSDTEDVALAVTAFNESSLLVVESVGYIGSTLVVFHGTDTQGKPLELIQHISQINVFLTAAAKPTPETPKRKIGFVQD